ncbi:class I SAM-dependent methyltransferase [Rhodomicrobium sp. Az07]|uniref:class I SAM-dependent methyltransferase n=1 Tax=Rhodomicrobium sp. Az07 TaxID=2839034 RepID=UPI001BEBFD15|nr:class I SAM-dependent methyltransferase [Rhodomicrobium sp. Az07]MBT3070667.1 class I SAM-dependent methyltransferase [Rhodomicrobium sp. Az07]
MAIGETSMPKNTGWGPQSRHRQSWHDRSIFAARLLRAGDVVCDLGAGSQSFKQVLPAGVGYVPVDCVDAIPGTYVADFNQSAFALPDAPYNVLTALGLINWLDDPQRFLSRLCKLADGKFFIFTYDLWPSKKNTPGLSHPEIGTLESAVYLFSPYIRNLTPIIVYRRRVLFSGTLGLGEACHSVLPSTTKIYLRYLRPQEYILMKFFGLDMMPRRLA